MSKISSSPNRNTFLKEGYINRCKEKGEEPNPPFYQHIKTLEEENLDNPNWKKNNLEYDLRSTGWILEKVRNSDEYAQHLYAAICNNDFIKNEIWPLLKEDIWCASWRAAGGIIADMRQEGDYIDWYCSGMHGGKWLDNKGEHYNVKRVTEGAVTDEIRQDLLKLGWVIRERSEDDY